MKINALVVLYNSKITDSPTIKTIFEANRESIKLNIIIWNNGPNLLDSNDVKTFTSLCCDKKINFEIYEDVRNISLSKIYNHFLNKLDYDFFTIFDQDSALSADFFINILNFSTYDFILPKIYEVNKQSKQLYPLNTKTDIPVTDGIFDIKNIWSIGSGFTISKNLITILRQKQKIFFDEDYCLYYCDTSFINLLKKIKNIKCYCTSSLIHNISANLQYSQMSRNTKIEMAYYQIISRYKERKKNIVKNIWFCLRFWKRAKISIRDFFKLVQCAFLKKHPRTSFKMDTNLNPILKNDHL